MLDVRTVKSFQRHLRWRRCRKLVVDVGAGIGECFNIAPFAPGVRMATRRQFLCPLLLLRLPPAGHRTPAGAQTVQLTRILVGTPAVGILTVTRLLINHMTNRHNNPENKPARVSALRSRP